MLVPMLKDYSVKKQSQQKATPTKRKQTKKLKVEEKGRKWVTSLVDGKI